nr:zinc finger, CCHC-type [Tanacetum cinerariifolium]
MKVEESLNVTFDVPPPPPKTSPLEDDELVEEEAIEVNKTKPIGNDLEDISLEKNQIVNIKESKTHPLENVIEDPKTSHLEAVKRIFRYIKGTTHLGLWYPKGLGMERIMYADSDHEGDYVDRKSTSGVCTFMGCFLTSWSSKKQTAFSISTTKAEYVSAEKACQQALWMKQALVDYGVRLDDFLITCDNKGAIDLSKNLVQRSRTKHIEIRHHFLSNNVQKGKISIERVPSEDNIADILTKPLKREPFNYLRLVQVDLTKEFLSSRFSMKDMGEADVILVSTPMDTCEKLMPNNGQAVSQLEYSRVIGCLMYVMTCTRPDISFVVGKLSRYTNNPSTQHWQAIQRALKYLKKTMDYRLMYSGYPLVLEGYTDASLINNTEDNSSISGWVFLLGGAAGKEAEWLKNLLLETPLWVKPITTISIHCDSAATLAKAYTRCTMGSLDI